METIRKTIKAILTVIIFIIGNDVIFVIANIIFPMLYTNQFNLDGKWINIYLILSFIYNIIHCLQKYMSTKERLKVETYAYLNKIKGNLFYEYANNLYREHKDVLEYIEKGKKIDTNIIKTKTNFQAVSFQICKQIYNIISKNGCDECQVTVFQRFFEKGKGKSDYVKMIAFAGKDNYKCKSYCNIYSYKQGGSNHEMFTKTIFFKLFDPNDKDVIIYTTKKAVENNFYFINESEDRERQICQYIGVGISTNRDYVEFILQVDVSKRFALGFTKKQLQRFVDEILMPYIRFLYEIYEIELFNKTMYNQLDWEH